MIDAENKARILNVNSVIDGELGGGTAERTIRLSEYLALRSYNVSILTLKIGNNIHIKGVDIILIPCINDRFFIPNPLYFFKILKCVKNIDVIHMMGHWSILNILVFFCQDSKKAICILSCRISQDFGPITDFQKNLPKIYRKINRKKRFIRNFNYKR